MHWAGALSYPQDVNAHLTNTRNCYDCQTETKVVRVTPKRYDDGHVRCPDCRRKHRDKIVAYWQSWKEGYPPHQNRGGMNLTNLP